MRVCPKCGERDAMEKDPRWCRECRIQYARARYLRVHPDALPYTKAECCKRCGSKEELAKHRRLCGDCVRLQKRSWYYNNIDRALKNRKKYVENNHEQIKTRQRERYWADVEKNREYSRTKRYRDGGRTDSLQRVWRQSHFFQMRASFLSSRCKTTVSAKDLWSIWKKQRGRCALTGRPMDGRQRHGAALDHIIPRVQGGISQPENLRWLCYEANVAKATLTDEALYRLCVDVITHKFGDADEEVNVSLGVPDWAMR